MIPIESFSDRIEKAIATTHSVLVAGIDPDVSHIPQCFHDLAEQSSSTDEEFFASLIANFYCSTLAENHDKIAAVKPNLAFFERYGIGGLRAYQSIISWCGSHQLQVIADAKRGDIGSTAAAYADAYLGQTIYAGRTIGAFSADALTVNPFLGFDTIQPFLDAAIEHKKGLFILVRTSNPGSADLQSIVAKDSDTDISARIAQWSATHSSLLAGHSGLSGLGAVVGATHPAELMRLRALMPNTIFLIPGFGAQGGDVTAIKQAALAGGRGILVNSSRAIFANIPSTSSAEQTIEIIGERIRSANQQLSFFGS